MTQGNSVCSRQQVLINIGYRFALAGYVTAIRGFVGCFDRLWLVGVCLEIYGCCTSWRSAVKCCLEAISIFEIIYRLNDLCNSSNV